MAETITTKPAVPVKTSTVNVDTKESLTAKLTELETYFNTFSGKKDHNPFFKLQHIEGLKTKLNKFGLQDNIADEINAIKQEPPKVN